jgi:hypothetical protein
LAFDADQTTKSEVRHALIRLYLLLSKAGAEVYQLTTWHLEQGKGIDDYLVAQGSERSAETLRALIAAAKPFSETLSSATPLDAYLLACGSRCSFSSLWALSPQSRSFSCTDERCPHLGRKRLFRENENGWTLSKKSLDRASLRRRLPPALFVFQQLYHEATAVPSVFRSCSVIYMSGEWLK